jgi:ethanolamine permease
VSAPTEHVQAQGLQRGRIGWVLLSGLGVSYVIGGDFAAWNFGLAQGGWGGMLIATAIAAAIWMILMATLAELSTIIPTAGGGYGFARAALGPDAAFITGVAILVEYAAAAAVVALVIEAYCKSLLGIGGWPVLVCAFVVPMVIHLYGAKEALGVTFFMTAVAAAGIAVFSWTMAPHFSVSHLLDTAPAPVTGASRFLPHGGMGVWAALPFATAFFLAVEGVSMAAEEAADPRRTLPRAMAAAMLVLGLLAALLLLAGPGAVGTSSLLDASDPLMAALSQVGLANSPVARLVNIAGLVGLGACIFSAVFAYSRQTFALSRAGYLPPALSRLSRRRIPALAIIVPGALAFVAALSGELEGLFVMMVFCATLSYLFMTASHIVLRRKRPALPRSYRTPGGAAGAAVAFAASLVLLMSCAIANLRWSLASLALIGFAWVLFFLFGNRRAKRAQSAEDELLGLVQDEARLQAGTP